MFDHLLESSHRDYSNKWSNIGFGEELKQVVVVETNFIHFLWSYEKGLFYQLEINSMVNHFMKLSCGDNLTECLTRGFI